MTLPKCDRCFDLGITLSPTDSVGVCPAVRVGLLHNAPTAGGQTLARSFIGQTVPQRTFDLARHLTRFTADEPCPGNELIARFFNYLPMSEHNQKRHLANAIEDLRKTWFLPVGARKDSQSGYWIITDIDDFAEWVNRAKAAPITQLRTIYAVAKRNFPAFAGQLELDFLTETDAELQEAA